MKLHAQQIRMGTKLNYRFDQDSCLSFSDLLSGKARLSTKVKMDQVRSAAGLRRYIMNTVRLTGRAAGPGSTGVELTTEGGLISVGKAVHVASVADLVQECALLFDLRHPNIIQYLGLHVSDSGSTLIVMEYLPDSLDHLLQKMSHLSLAMKYSILCDVCRGLEYLHCRTSPVVHDKLSASNVLLTSAMKAKISDVSAFFRSSYTSSMTPRELSYLPPEVQDANPHYSVAVDIFSFGQLSLYTLFQEFPTPTAPTCIDINNPEAVITRTEIQRRASYLQQLSDQLGDTSHPAVKLINQCLQNDPNQRPSIQQVASYLKEWTVPSDSYQQMTKLELVGKIREMAAQCNECNAKLQQKTVEVQQLQSMMENVMQADQAESASGNHGDQIEVVTVPDSDVEITMTTNQPEASTACEQVGPSSSLCQADFPFPSVLMVPMVADPKGDKTELISSTVQQQPFLAVQPIQQQLLESEELKPFSCTYCEAKFARHNSLQVHLRVHTGEKPYACSECTAKFTQSGALKAHLRRHAGEKPFMCEQCPAKFPTAGCLKQHMRTHSGAKPFSCWYCSKTFARSHNLRNHIRSVHPEVKGLFCIYCDARFSNPATLKQHHRTHSGDKPFYCIHCKARFSESLALRQHVCSHMLVHVGGQIS